MTYLCIGMHRINDFFFLFQRWGTTRIPCTFVYPQEGALRFVWKQETKEQYQIVCQTCFHHGQLRGIDPRIPQLHQGNLKIFFFSSKVKWLPIWRNQKDNSKFTDLLKLGILKYDDKTELKTWDLQWIVNDRTDI